MKIVPPSTFEEELMQLKKVFLVTLDKYNNCMKLYSSTGSSDKKKECDLLKGELNKIIN